jgi:hypothetical protein
MPNLHPARSQEPVPQVLPPPKPGELQPDTTARSAPEPKSVEPDWAAIADAATD